MKYALSAKLLAVQDYLNGHYGFKIIARKHQVPVPSLRAWCALYQNHGEPGLHPGRRFYTPAFRSLVVATVIREKLSMRTAAARFNIADHKTVKCWLNAASVLPAVKGKQRVIPNKPKPPKKPEDMTPEELVEEVLYLRAERAYHEKLDALMAEKAKRKKK